MVGALNKLPVAASGMLFFSDPVTPGSVSAIIVGSVAGLLYALSKNNQVKLTNTQGRTELPLTVRRSGDGRVPGAKA